MCDSNKFPGSSSDQVLRSIDSDAQRIESSAQSIESKVYAGKRLARFFQLEVSLKLFGNEIFHWSFPPQSN